MIKEVEYALLRMMNNFEIQRGPSFAFSPSPSWGERGEGAHPH
jgi:hypothetical protein